MTEKLKQIIKREMLKLPKDVQDAMNSLDWVTISEETGKKYFLNESEINDLQVQTLLVLAGLTALDDFAQDIENEVGTSKDEAEKITIEINKKIFTPIDEVIEENIKKTIKIKGTKWNQNLNFILSGGDYSIFLPPRHEDMWNLSSSESKTTTGQDEKTVTPAVVPVVPQETDTTTIPKKMEDIKSKLVI